MVFQLVKLLVVVHSLRVSFDSWILFVCVDQNVHLLEVACNQEVSEDVGLLEVACNYGVLLVIVQLMSYRMVQ